MHIFCVVRLPLMSRTGLAEPADTSAPEPLHQYFSLGAPSDAWRQRSTDRRGTDHRAGGRSR
jgi:hypothetical protein